ncbi:hypothetical protein GH714_023845 [Hevea brasiliensis]|uniref:Protein kinase domain-containing protein n=1 Tax=Hevea brasiliensis TaxID=3981 RepID=A0A6A6N6D2_HEVBR|nr:hypothetical protein GH714_023845 [Hevea brasiliensis]
MRCEKSGRLQRDSNNRNGPANCPFGGAWKYPRVNQTRRRSVLEKQLASSDASQEEQINLLKDLERKETEYMRMKRHKICIDDFDLLTIIGRGAFGEVRLCREKKSGNIYAMKKLKKSEMLRRDR